MFKNQVDAAIFLVSFVIFVGGASVFLQRGYKLTLKERVARMVKELVVAISLLVALVSVGTVYSRIQGEKMVTFFVRLNNATNEKLKDTRIWTNYGLDALELTDNNTWKLSLRKKNIRGTPIEVFASAYTGGQVQFGQALVMPTEARRTSVDISLSNAVAVQGQVVNKKGQGVPSTVFFVTKISSRAILQSADTDNSGTFTLFFNEPLSPDAKITIDTVPQHGKDQSDEFTVRDFPVKIVLRDE